MKEIHTIISVYIFFLLALLLQMIPMGIMQAASLIMLVGVFYYNGRMKRNADKTGLAYTHGYFIGRTIILSGIILSLGAGASGVFLAHHFRLDGLLSVMSAFARSRDASTPEVRLIMHGVLAGALPGMIYLLQRILRGIFLAARGKPANLSWL